MARPGVWPQEHGRHEAVKRRFLVAWRKAAREGKKPRMTWLAARFRCSLAWLYELRKELIREGQIALPQEVARTSKEKIVTDHFAQRIAAVKAQKRDRWEPGEACPALSEDELRRILPD